MSLIVNGTEIENIIVIKRATGESTELELLQDINGVEIWIGISQLDKLIDRSIARVSAEDLEGVTKIGASAFQSCSGLTNIDIPNSVTSIGDSAFNGCTGLTNIPIPNSVTSIGVSAFYGCTGLTSITLPSSVTAINLGAFSGCTSLTTIKILATTPPFINKSSTIPDNTTRIEVPADSLSAYQSDADWSAYSDRLVGV